MRLASEALFRLPDTARLWAFGVSRALQPDEEARLLTAVDRFLDGWNAHGQPLAAARAWLDGRFLLVGVDDSLTPPSGCSIDALVGTLREVERAFGVEIVGGGSVWYRDAARGGEPRTISRTDFQKEVARGAVTEDTIVFDFSLTRVEELRQGRWELPAGRSWHRRYFRVGSGPSDRLA
ncbi:MAG: hypothetical protein EXR92_07445 [Gemmatimonadetes bacterium]|nr:hypothetical protein [Gemmatimonadota bacterium]